MEILNNNILKASENCTLVCKLNNKNYGKEAYLGLLFYDQNGNKLKTPYNLLPSDFYELHDPIPDSYEIDGTKYDFRGWSYADIKTFIIKLHYTDDDQTAIILNYLDDPIKHKDRYDRMQEWRKYASEVARKYN